VGRIVRIRVTKIVGRAVRCDRGAGLEGWGIAGRMDFLRKHKTSRVGRCVMGLDMYIGGSIERRRIRGVYDLTLGLLVLERCFCSA